MSVSVALPSFANLITSSVNTSTEPNPESIKAALSEFKNLSKKGRKERVSEAKKEIKKIKKESNKRKVDQALLIILAVLLPPLAVYLHQGEVNSKFWISLVLTLLLFLPGVIYSLLVVTDNA
jgi:uncharacterized membrane protein YqaE (UPF0057 family)